MRTEKNITVSKRARACALSSLALLYRSANQIDQNQRIGPFDAARLILGGASRTPLRDRYELFFTDYSLLPLLVHQNYLGSLMNVDAKVRTDVTAAASAAVSDADIISGKMRCAVW